MSKTTTAYSIMISPTRTWRTVVYSSRAFFIVGMLASAFGQPKQQVWRELDPRERSRVMELAFPRTIEPRTVSQATLILRFSPSFAPESQIIVSMAPDHRVSIQYKAARITLQEAFRRVSQLEASSPAALVKRMEVKSSDIQLTSETSASWFRQFWVALAASSTKLGAQALTGQVQLDGTNYYCEYEEPTVHLIVELQASELDTVSAGDPALVKWMSEVRRTVQRLAQSPRDQ